MRNEGLTPEVDKSWVNRECSILPSRLTGDGFYKSRGWWRLLYGWYVLARPWQKVIAGPQGKRGIMPSPVPVIAT